MRARYERWIAVVFVVPTLGIGDGRVKGEAFSQKGPGLVQTDRPIGRGFKAHRTVGTVAED